MFPWVCITSLQLYLSSFHCVHFTAAKPLCSFWHLIRILTGAGDQSEGVPIHTQDLCAKVSEVGRAEEPPEPSCRLCFPLRTQSIQQLLLERSSCHGIHQDSQKTWQNLCSWHLCEERVQVLMNVSEAFMTKSEIHTQGKPAPPPRGLQPSHCCAG